MNSKNKILSKLINKNSLIIGIVVVLSFLSLGFLIVSKQGTLSNQQRKYIAYGSEIGADLTQLEEAFLSKEIEEIIAGQESEYVSKYGESKSTPTIALNGERIESGNLQNFMDKIKTKIEEVKADETQKLPVILEEYIDFNCTHCATFDVITYQLSDIFPASELQIVTKNLPFLKPTSRDFAKLFESAKLQGKGTEMKHKIFKTVHPNNVELYNTPISYPVVGESNSTNINVE